MSVDVALVEEIAPYIHDAHGHGAVMPKEVRDAIAATASDEDDAATLAFWTFRESGWDPRAKGDGRCIFPDGKVVIRRWGGSCPEGSKVSWLSCGLGQTPCGRTPRDALGQIRLVRAIMEQSRETCPLHPLAAYAGGCEDKLARKIAFERTKIVAEIVEQVRSERVFRAFYASISW